MTTANFGSLIDDSIMQNQPIEQTVQQLIDKVSYLQKQMEFQLNGNLDSTNAREIGGWFVGDDRLASEDGDVGFSTKDTGADDIRIWAGGTDPASATFSVTKSGKMKASTLDAHVLDIEIMIFMGVGSYG